MMLTHRLALTTTMMAALGLAACKPPPSDDTSARAISFPIYRGPSAPIASPDTSGAVWTLSESQPERIVYGIPGEPVMLALECRRASDAGTAATIRINRHAPADKGAGALLALIGNGAIGRLEVDATPQGKGHIWRGEAPADHPGWEPLSGPRELTATVPGAGLVRLNPSPLPMQLLESCWNPVPSPAPTPAEPVPAE